MKTYMANKDAIERKWYVVDATDKTLGRLASEIVPILCGKNKPYYTPSLDCGDYVIVVNADKIKVTGKKMTKKMYYRHSRYIGGYTFTSLRDMLKKDPAKVVELAVQGMMPHTRLGDQMVMKLHVYAGPEHKHAAQKPEVLDI